MLITGCSSGIGYALAEAFHASGCTTYAPARNPASLSALTQRGIHALALDVRSASSITAATAQIETAHGAVDVLVNNAGIPVMGPAAELPVDEFRRQWETNLTGPMAMVQAVVPAMVKKGTGRIVNVGSGSGLLTTPFAGAYCASKAALHSLNDALRMELKPFGIDVLLVQPGGVQSKFGAGAKSQTSKQQWRLYSRFAEGIARRAGASQEKATPADEFSKNVVSAVLAVKPKAVIRLGAGAGTYARLAQLPIAIKDRILMKRFGLT